jgi:ABC-type antimicrobial peptide transport system permease subunit
VILGNILRVAFRSLGANKMLLVLTMLGIIIGVAAVIAMLALGEGAREESLSRFREMGSNLLILGNSRGRARQQRLSTEEWHAIESLTEYVTLTAPEANTTVPVKHGNKTVESRIIGTTPAYFTVRNVPVALGQPFSDAEVHQIADVCVLGAKVAEDLFGDLDPIDSTVYLGRRRTQVIGVAKEKGEGWSSQDSMVMAPLTTVMYRLAGQAHIDRIHISCHSHEIVQEAQAAVTDLLRRRRGLTLREENNFRFFAVTELIDQIEESAATFKALLGGVAAVSLLVGGIGIMNVMLVTVTERTREIGVRKALGARRRDILLQFLVESVVVACVGGVLGIAVSFGVAALFDRFSEQFSPLISGSSIVLAVAFSATVGLIFGIYPAHRASRLDPIEALRHE